jgi:hypothetical protein
VALAALKALEVRTRKLAAGQERLAEETAQVRAEGMRARKEYDDAKARLARLEHLVPRR